MRRESISQEEGLQMLFQLRVLPRVEALLDPNGYIGDQYDNVNGADTDAEAGILIHLQSK